MFVASMHHYNTASTPQTAVWVLTATGQQHVSEVVASIAEYRRQFDIPFETAADDGAVFNNLAEQWHVERGASSSLTDMVLCPSYQKIIGMGPKAIDLIVARLRSERNDPDHWFWALQALTGENPVSDEDEGNLQGMARAWFRWAEKSGHAS